MNEKYMNEKETEEEAAGFQLYTPTDLPSHSESKALHTDLQCAKTS